MANQWTPKSQRSSRSTVSVKLSKAELAEIERGAKALGETRSETLRRGALGRAASAVAPVPRYLCEYCPAGFATRAEAQFHVDAKH